MHSKAPISFSALDKTTFPCGSAFVLKVLMYVRLADREVGSVQLSQSTTRIVFHATDRISYNEKPAGTYKSGGQSNSLHTTSPFSFIQHHSDGSVSKDWSVLGRGYGDNVEHSRLFTGSKSYIFFPLWLFSIYNFVAGNPECFCPCCWLYIRGIYFAPWLPFIVSVTSLKWTHKAEGPNMKVGDDGILNKYCKYYFLCAVCTLWGQMEDLEEHPFSIFTLRLWWLFFCLWVCHTRWIQN